MHINQQPDADKVLSLLEQNGLPVSDLQENTFEDYFCCGDKSNPAGVAGLEFLEKFGLLRSLVVSEKSRGKGCGKSLVETIERYAQRKGLQSLYLLTDTAAPFFARIGYIEVSRAAVPEAILDSVEFSSLCSDEAVVMKKDIHTGHFISIYP